MLIGIDASRATVARPTGTEHYSWRLIRHLIALDTQNHYRLYLRDRPPPDHFPATAEQRIIPFPRLWTHIRLSLEMAIHPPDVLYVPAHVLPLIHPRRTVVTVHDLGYLYYPEAHRTIDRLYLDRSTRWNAQQASHIITISAATREDLVKHYGIDPTRITVVYPGVNEEIRRIHDAAAIRTVLSRYGLQERYLLYVGTLQPRKNLVRLVRAYAEVVGTWHKPTSPPELVLAGQKGWAYDQIMAWNQTLGIESKVRFPGYIPQSDLPALLSGADAFVYPSLYEGFGFPILEAMACGTPVVCTRTACLPEIAGDAALLVDPHDESELAAAIVRVLTDEALRATLIARGIKRAASFPWERCARETLDILERVGRPSSPRGE